MELTPREFEHYVKKIKEHEKLRLSTNERQAYWKRYFKKATKGRTETSFDMNQF